MNNEEASASDSTSPSLPGARLEGTPSGLPDLPNGLTLAISLEALPSLSSGLKLIGL
jgi:hypothetical protein